MNDTDPSVERNNELAMRVARGFAIVVMVVLALMVAFLLRG